MGRGRRRCLGLQEGDRLIGPLALFPRLACGQSYKGSLDSALPQPPPAGVPQVGPGSPSPLMESVWVNKSHHHFVLLSSPSPTNTRLETPWPGFSGRAVLRGTVFRMGTHQGDGKWNLPSYVQGPLWMWYPGPATVMRIPGCPRLPPAFTRRLWSFRTA